jgi:lipopolysaccharide transport system ATP-binding protein
MKDLAIKVKSLSKKYYLSNDNSAFSFNKNFGRLFNLKNKNKERDSLFALKDINFELQKGETLGIIGRNGAGKSTLLKVLSEVTEFDSGKIEIYGNVVSILEVGTGFHPDLTGRENIYLNLNSAMFGLSKKQIDENIADIISFSGIERFIDTPVKHYSSGMYLRLAFSVVTNIDADIFLFDEVLAVGDLAFQLKCREKIISLAASNKTVVISSHNHFSIVDLCSKVMHLENGNLVKFGGTDIVREYFEESLASDPPINSKDKEISSHNSNSKNNSPEVEETICCEWKDLNNAPGDSKIRIKNIYIYNESKKGSKEFYTNDRLSLNVEYEKYSEDDFYDMGFGFIYMNFPFMACNSANSDINTQAFKEKGSYTAKVYIDEYFLNDVIISVSFAIFKNNSELVYRNTELLRFRIKPFVTEDETILSKIQNSIPIPIQAKLHWEITKNNN